MQNLSSCDSAAPRRFFSPESLHGPAGLELDDPCGLEIRQTMGPDFVKRLLCIIVSVCILFTAISEESAHASEDVVLESIEVIAGNDKPEQVVFKLSGSHTPTSFRLNGDNPRLIFDFYGVTYPSDINRISDVGGDIIDGIRVGRHDQPPKTRVVVDIQQDSPYLHEQTFNVSNNSLVITLTPDFSEESIPLEAPMQPPRIEVDSQKVVRSSGQAQSDSESIQPLPGDEEKSPPPQDSPAEPAGDEASEETAKPTEPSPEAVPETPQPLTSPVQPSEQGPAEQETQPPAPDQPVEPAVADSSEESVESPEPVPETETDVTQPLTPPVQPSEEGPAEQETQTATSDQPVAPESDVAGDIKPVLLEVSFEKSINDSETVLFRLNHFYPPLVFGVEKGEPRVICHFLDASKGSNIPSSIEAGGQFINRIQVTEEPNPDKVKVELILVPNRNYDLQQLFFKEENLFVIIVKELQENGAASN